MILGADSISGIIQTAIAPVFLLAGVGGIMNVIATRLARAVDRRRILEGLYDAAESPQKINFVSELRVLDRRIKYANTATSLCVSSALAVCLVVILHVGGQLAGWLLSWAIALAFMSAMILLALGLIAFLIEIQIALGSLRVRTEIVGHSPNHIANMIRKMMQ